MGSLVGVGRIARGKSSTIVAVALVLAVGGALFLVLSGGDVGLAREGSTASSAQAAGAGASTSPAQAWIEQAEADLVDVALTPDGQVAYAAGHAGDGDAGALVVRAMDPASGETVWTVRLPEQGPGFAAAVDVEVGPDGDRVVLAGHARADYGAYTPVAVALDAGDGALLWSAELPAPASTVAAGLAVPSQAGPAYVATWAPEEPATVHVHALDLVDGGTLGSVDVGEALGASLQPTALAAAPDGGEAYLLAWAADGTELVTAAVDAAGEELAWEAREPGTFSNGWPLPSPRVAVDPASGTVVVAAAEGPSQGPRTAHAFAYEQATGARAWQADLADGASIADPVALDVAPEDGRVYAALTERSPDAPDGHARTVALALEDGHRAWSAQGPPGSHAAEIALGPAGERVYVTGWTADETPRSLTLAYEADGGEAAWLHEGQDGKGAAASVHPNASRVLALERSPDEATSTLRTLDTGLAHGAQAAPDEQAGAVAPAGEARYPVTVENTGDLPATVELRVTGLDDGWTAYTEHEGEPTSTLEVEAGQTRTVDLVVVPPVDALAGASWANLTAEPVQDATRGSTAATHTTVDAGQAPEPRSEPTARLAPPCPWLEDHAGTTLDGPVVCGAPALATDQANATLAEALSDPAHGSQAPDQRDRGADPAEDARLERWWTGLEHHRTPGPDEPSGPQDFAGEWTDARDLHGETVHAALLPSGNVLYYTELGGGFVWDPVTELRIEEANPETWLFCSGMAQLADGDLYAPGGTKGIFPFVGLETAEVFDHRNRSWSTVAQMEHERWYPTAVTLGDGRVGVLTGLTYDDENGGYIIEDATVYDPEADTYEDAGSRLMPTYSKAYTLPSGNVFITSPARMSMEWNPDTGTFHNVSQREGPLRIGGGSALLDATDGTVLEFGGGGGDGIDFGDSVTDTAEVFDPQTAAWEPVGSLHHARLWPDAVLLPDGDVLAVGGATEEHEHNHTEAGADAVDPLPAEVYDVENRTWIEGETPSTPMAYHSTTLLLRDGRVLAVNQHEMDPQFYEPWYLQVDDRPRVLEAPADAGYGVPLNVQVDEAGGVDELALFRHSAVTHSLNTDQREIELSTTTLPGYPAVRAELPTNPSYAPPGTYMVFALDDGVPSRAPSLTLAEGPLDVPHRPPSALGPVPASDPAGDQVQEVVERQLDEHRRHGNAHGPR